MKVNEKVWGRIGHVYNETVFENCGGTWKNFIMGDLEFWGDLLNMGGIRGEEEPNKGTEQNKT